MLINVPDLVLRDKVLVLKRLNLLFQFLSVLLRLRYSLLKVLDHFLMLVEFLDCLFCLLHHFDALVLLSSLFFVNVGKRFLQLRFLLLIQFS